MPTPPRCHQVSLITAAHVPTPFIVAFDTAPATVGTPTAPTTHPPNDTLHSRHRSHSKNANTNSHHYDDDGRTTDGLRDTTSSTCAEASMLTIPVIPTDGIIAPLYGDSLRFAPRVSDSMHIGSLFPDDDDTGTHHHHHRGGDALLDHPSAGVKQCKEVPHALPPSLNTKYSGGDVASVEGNGCSSPCSRQYSSISMLTPLTPLPSPYPMIGGFAIGNDGAGNPLVPVSFLGAEHLCNATTRHALFSRYLHFPSLAADHDNDEDDRGRAVAASGEWEKDGDEDSNTASLYLCARRHAPSSPATTVVITPSCSSNDDGFCGYGYHHSIGNGCVGCSCSCCGPLGVRGDDYDDDGERKECRRPPPLPITATPNALFSPPPLPALGNRLVLPTYLLHHDDYDAAQLLPPTFGDYEYYNVGDEPANFLLPFGGVAEAEVECRHRPPPSAAPTPPPPAGCLLPTSLRNDVGETMQQEGQQQQQHVHIHTHANGVSSAEEEGILGKEALLPLHSLLRISSCGPLVLPPNSSIPTCRSVSSSSHHPFSSSSARAAVRIESGLLQQWQPNHHQQRFWMTNYSLNTLSDDCVLFAGYAVPSPSHTP